MEWVDVLKGVLIILVVLGHNIQFGSGTEMFENNLYFENPLFRFIYSFHMPCLMLISGYFFNVNKKYLWKKRIQTILIPTLAWSQIPIGYGLLKATVKHQINEEVVINALHTLFTYYWFLWAILFCSFIVWIVHHCFRNSIIAYVLFAVFLMFVPEFLNSRMWTFMYPYFTAGYLWKRSQMSVSKEHKWAIEVILIICYALLFAFFKTESFIYTTGITVRSISDLGIDIYRYAIGFVGSALMIWSVYLIYPILNVSIKKMVSYCGRASLSIYIVDSLLNSYILQRLTKNFTLNYGVVAVETIIVVIFCVSTDWIIKRVSFARKILLGSR